MDINAGTTGAEVTVDINAGTTGAEGIDMMVRISEMYDMATTVGKIGIIGIHTPTIQQIARRWNGLMVNHKFMRIVSCNVSMACASMLPADPLQIGLEAGAIAPQDMMNPVLYKPVSNESWDVITGRLYASSGATPNINSIKAFSDGISTLDESAHENIYYNLLSEPSWRKAMPQEGLSMKGLKPLVFPMLSQFGNGEVGISNFGLDGSGLVASSPAGSPATVNNPATTGTPYPDNVRYFRGHAQPMPRFPTAMYISLNDSDSFIGDSFKLVPTGASGLNLPRTYVACLVTPPAKLQRFFYRLMVSWTIEFSEVCTASERLSASGMSTLGALSYLRSYTVPVTLSSTLKTALDEDEELDDTVSEVGFVDALNGDVELVMEK